MIVRTIVRVTGNEMTTARGSTESTNAGNQSSGRVLKILKLVNIRIRRRKGKLNKERFNLHSQSWTGKCDKQ